MCRFWGGIFNVVRLPVNPDYSRYPFIENSSERGGDDAVGLVSAGECPAPDIHGYPPAERRATITTRVQFAPLSPAEIEAYVATGEPLQCAGGFALEGRGGALVERIEGCFSNVIGLSLPLLRCWLAQIPA